MTSTAGAGGSSSPEAGSTGDAMAIADTGSGTGANHGTQANPGTDGDGTFPQPAPYNQPPETLMRLNGAPAGMLSAPAIYASKAVYPLWKFTYWIYVPAQYKPGQRAALMVFQDGRHYLGLTDAKFNTPTVFDNLINSKEMPVTIGLFIDPGSPSGTYHDPQESGIRSQQYDTPSDVYTKFLVDEIIPDVITSKYDIVEDPDGWAVSGHSSGGIVAFMAGWYRPDKFHKLLTHNASFPNTKGVFPAEILKVTPAKPLRVYLLSSTNDLGGWLNANTEAYRDLTMLGYHVRFRTGSGNHFPPLQAVADFPDSLRWMWRNYTIP